MRILILLLLAGCATPTLRHSHTSLSVPFLPQKPGYCGPAALAMLASYYGQPVTQDEIASAIYLPEINGTLTSELTDYAKRFGLFVRQYRGAPEDLRQKLHAGIPMLVFGKIGRNFHYFLVLADGDPLVVHSDTRARLPVRREDFLRWWELTGRWTLLVCPPERMTWALSGDEHNDLGVYLEAAGKFVDAETHYRAACQLVPDNGWFAVNLGNALRRQGKLREAADAFARAPDNVDALNNRADVLCELGENLDGAAALCRRAIELMPGRRAYYLDTLGCILLKQGGKQEARAAFEQALAATTDRQSTLRETIRRHLKETE